MSTSGGTRRGDKYVTVIIDLAAIRAGIGPARLLDMVEGRSKQGFTTWLSEREPAWRGWVEVVAMDGFTGFKTATTETLPDAVAVMDPFHVVHVTADALDRCRRRVQLGCMGTAAAEATRSTSPPHAAPRRRLPHRELAWPRCSPPMSTRRSRRPGASTSAWSPHTATLTTAKGRRR